MSLSQFVTGFTILETSLGAIARLHMFEATTEVEAKATETLIPADNWPGRGEIEFLDVSASYE